MRDRGEPLPEINTVLTGVRFRHTGPEGLRVTAEMMKGVLYEEGVRYD